MWIIFQKLIAEGQIGQEDFTKDQQNIAVEHGK
jgi:hypothetical protein